MKKATLFTIVCVMRLGFAFGQDVNPRGPQDPLGQHTQSLSFNVLGPITPGSTFNVSVSLTFSGYSAFGLSYWLEVDNALAPFLSITGVTYFTFPDPNQTSPNPAPFSSTIGSTAGFMLETRDLGATVNDPNVKMVPQGTYHITDLQFTLAAGAPSGTYTVRSTSVNPRISEVTDTTFSDNNIIPAGSFVIVVPEPSTFALLVTAIGFGFLAYRRQKQQ